MHGGYDPTRMPAKGPTPASVVRLRTRMDRLNARLVALLQERARLARQIGALKARHGLAAADPARERAMLGRMLADAPPGFPRRELARILRALLAASRRLVLAARDEREVSPVRSTRQRST
jgi:chorismate mutase / prephenate dehydratase